VREHAVDDPVRHSSVCAHQVVALHVLGDRLEWLPAVLSDQLLDPPRERDRVPRVNLDVARLASRPPPSSWMTILAFGSAIRSPRAPPASSSAPIEIAIRTAIVAIAGLTNCADRLAHSRVTGNAESDFAIAAMQRKTERALHKSSSF
jgi:hypothetical protein